MDLTLAAWGAGAVAVGGGVILCAFRFVIVPHLTWSRAWLSAPGAVVGAGKPYGSGDFREYPVEVTFQTFDGTAHTKTFTPRVRHEAGDTVDVRYNPRDVDQAMLWPRRSSDVFGGTMLALFGLAAAGAGVALLVKSLLTR